MSFVWHETGAIGRSDSIPGMQREGDSKTDERGGDHVRELGEGTAGDLQLHGKSICDTILQIFVMSFV